MKLVLDSDGPAVALPAPRRPASRPPDPVANGPTAHAVRLVLALRRTEEGLRPLCEPERAAALAALLRRAEDLCRDLGEWGATR